MNKCGDEEKPDDVLFLFPLFLDEKKGGDRKSRGKRGTQQLEKGTGRQVFTDLIA